MKVRARVCRYEDIEVEVSDRFTLLTDDEFLSKCHGSSSYNLSTDLAEKVNEEIGDDETEVIYIEDMDGNMLFER